MTAITRRGNRTEETRLPKGCLQEDGELAKVAHAEAVRLPGTIITVDENRCDSGGPGADDVRIHPVPDVHCLGRCAPRALQREAEDGWIRFLGSGFLGVGHGIEISGESQGGEAIDKVLRGV